MQDHDLLLLLISDDTSFGKQLEQYIQEISRWDLYLEQRSDRGEISKAIQSRRHDILMIDYDLREDDGLDLLINIRRENDQRPVFFLTGQGNEELITEFIQSGGDQYLLKTELSADTVERSITTCIQEKPDLFEDGLLHTEQDPDSLEVLFLDDDDADIELFRRSVKAIDTWDVCLDAETKVEDALEQLNDNHYDLIVLDYFLGAQTGLDVLKEIREQRFRQPIIILTGQGNQQIAAEVIRAGGDHYLTKSDLSTLRLRKVFQHVLKKHNRREKKDIDLEKHDLLTGLHKHDYFLTLAERRIRQKRKEINEISLIRLDIDEFEKINFLYGMITGDRILSRVGETLYQLVDSGLIARTDDDEFCVLLENWDLEEVRLLARRINRKLSRFQLLMSSTQEVPSINIRIGISVHTFEENSTASPKSILEGLFERTRLALEETKSHPEKSNIRFEPE